MGTEKLAWHETGMRELLKTPVMTVNETESVSPDGQTGRYIVNTAPDWAIVIAEKNGKFLMVKQWRHGERALSIEFPGGVIEPGEPPERAAARELKEETGYEAAEIIPLGTMNPNPALFRNHVHVFAARGLRPAGAQHLDADEYVSYFELPKSEVYQNMGSAEYPHALMSAALLRYKIHFDNTAGSAAE